MEVPPHGWFLRETFPFKWMIWGYPYFVKPPKMGSRQALDEFLAKSQSQIRDLAAVGLTFSG